MENAGGKIIRTWRIARWTVIAGLLVMPWIAMQFTREVNWTAADFVAMATLLIGAGLVFELAAAKLRKPIKLALIGIGIAGGVLLIWAEGAVGIFH